MPDDDWALSNGTVEFRQEERQWALGRFECDRDDIDESAGLRDCTCLEYGHGMNLTRVVRSDCPYHGQEDVE